MYAALEYAQNYADDMRHDRSLSYCCMPPDTASNPLPRGTA